MSVTPWSCQLTLGWRTQRWMRATSPSSWASTWAWRRARRAGSMAERTARSGLSAAASGDRERHPRLSPFVDQDRVDHRVAHRAVVGDAVLPQRPFVHRAQALDRAARGDVAGVDRE